MNFTDTDRRELLRALDELAAGRHQGFHDRLWLAFGDQWTLVLEHLTAQRWVRAERNGRGHPRLTEEGGTLIARLREALPPTAAPSPSPAVAPTSPAVTAGRPFTGTSGPAKGGRPSIAARRHELLSH